MKGPGEHRAFAYIGLVIASLALLLAVALVACGGSDTTESAAPTAAPSEAASPSVAASPSGIPLPTPTVAGTIAFTREVDPDWDYDVCVVSTDGTNLKTLAGGEGCQLYPRWSPDGSRIVYMQEPPGDKNPQDLWVMNADGSGKTQLTNPTNSPVTSRTPDWSPDGSQIVFTSFITDVPELAAVAVMNADGSHLRMVTKPKGAATDYWPTWAADGRIYFWRLDTAGGPSYEYSVKPDGSGLKLIMKLGSRAQCLDYGISPDGRRVVLQDVGADRLSVVSVRGGDGVTLLDPVSSYFGDAAADVAWSPDARTLALASLYDTGFTRLLVVNADGTGLSAVPGLDAVRDPAWRPE